jgi:hypothetical protein
MGPVDVAKNNPERTLVNRLQGSLPTTAFLKTARVLAVRAGNQKFKRPGLTFPSRPDPRRRG